MWQRLAAWHRQLLLRCHHASGSSSTALDPAASSGNAAKTQGCRPPRSCSSKTRDGARSRGFEKTNASSAQHRDAEPHRQSAFAKLCGARHACGGRAIQLIANRVNHVAALREEVTVETSCREMNAILQQHRRHRAPSTGTAC